MYYPYYFDPTYFLVIIGVIICALASAKVNSTYARYDQVRNHAGITGAMAAEQILRMEGIYDVQVMRVSGKLTDHYDPCIAAFGFDLRFDIGCGTWSCST